MSILILLGIVFVLWAGSPEYDKEQWNKDGAKVTIIGLAIGGGLLLIFALAMLPAYLRLKGY
ncbi:hypothetical protein ACUN9Y_15000 [Halomonas sp. V046]|uniref:hypothetical protein n=1 Tax=Halomonas sp. V046 TaxID=3459611 RepID=UPI0040445989